ncbi:MAG: hypothetical protein QOI66_1405, partial [Myxococcales bacterium]|nr:hypothetical protein [Myxococcales bacterium]
ASDLVSIQDTGSNAPDSASEAPPSPGDAPGDSGSPLAVKTVEVKAGAAAVGELAPAKLTVPSNSYDQDVVVTMQAWAPATAGPIGAVYRLEQSPALVHSRNALHFELQLSADQQPMAAQLRLATLKDVPPDPAFWYATTGQQYDAATHTLSADFFGLDRGPVFFTILRACATKNECATPTTCSSALCQ